MMKKIFPLTILLASCSHNQNPAGAIAPEKFEAIYIELLDSAAIAQPSSIDSTLSPTAERILQRHEVSIEQYKSTVASYNTDIRKWKVFYDDIVKKFDERSKKPAE